MLAFGDARYYQIAALSALIGYGCFFFEFPVSAALLIATISSALVSQYAASWFADTRFDPLSPLISALSLCLLLRVTDGWLLPFAAMLAISSKFVLRARGKHLFNPTTFAIVTLLLVSENVWVSSGQWGQLIVFALLIAMIGLMVVLRAQSTEVSLAFLGFYCSLVIARGLWLGDPLAISIHHLTNGALLIFAFFMISDPKTTPNARPARIIFALSVAALSYWIEFHLYRANGVLFALIIAAPFVPILDRFVLAPRFEWQLVNIRNRKRIVNNLQGENQ